ncbi:MAG: 2-phosphosulfolactate phosphatase [Anaerolineaceae bacterium]
MEKVVLIDWFNETKPELDDDYAVIAIDVIRATTTAVTGVARGRRCFPVSSIVEAQTIANELKYPLLVGELGGNMPYGFDLQNSPSLIEERGDLSRPMVLLSTSGTRLITEYRSHEALFIACLRNYSSLVTYLAANHPRVALIGAGTRGEFREEDQLCAAWIAARLVQFGYRPATKSTSEIMEHWKDESAEVIREGNSAAYLMRSGQVRDLEFVLNHIDDLPFIYKYKDKEIVELLPEQISKNGKEKVNAK